MTATFRPRPAGFTLVELMIVLVIAAILMSVAIPAYQSQIRKSRRTDAKTALLDLAAREQRYFSVQNSFTSSFVDLGYATGAPPTSVTVGSGYYNVTVTTAVTTPPGFLLTATATGVQTSDTSCNSFTVDNTGLQKAYNSGGTDNTTNCW